ncbi:MAG TPA: glycine--tRNA ligase subunit beta [Bryobacteraceae bacterium]|jgi:glycyl-tRNA synthetase beta chain|nr:glycine--tRNA ligase subunit beta [Bryobacteraceae bacterium]
MNLLLEIGVEEIPDWMLAGAKEYLGGAGGGLLKAHQLGDASIRTDSTPRRLVVRAEGVIRQQPDSEERVWGPAKSAPQAAVAGFAKKQGVGSDQLEILSDGKAEKYSYVRKVKGRAASAILAEALPELILKTPFPKSMYWVASNEPGKGPVRFIRPIRWIVALLDNQVIPFEIAGVPAGNQSSGHRKLGAARFPVSYENYEEKLRENFVILSFDERRKRIRAVPTKYMCDNELLDTLVNLTEWPTPITGSFDPEFLDLPKEVLIMVMRHHQKYLSVETPDGNLAPTFVAVTNTDGDPDGLIRHGNERVLRARFNDARFFWQADQKRKLTDRVQDLANVTFQAKLGSYLEKTDRVEELVLTLLLYAANPGKPLTETDIRNAKVRYTFGADNAELYAVRAARLAKTDLTTELVKEFTELQGVIGGLYARAQGEPEEVAVAIYDHYKPVSMEDSIPRTPAGQLLSIADKLDTLRGCFRVGLIPSGSKDPFALRRAAQGIVKILVEGKLRLPIQTLCEGSLPLEEFLAERVRYYFREIRGFQYDEVSAVLVSGWDDLLDVEERLEAVRAVRPTEDFEPLAASFKRIRNILKQAQFEGLGDALDASLLESGPESALYEKFMSTREACRVLADYRARLEQIASLRPHVDLFFDKILVNAPQPDVRRNRLTLLHTMLAEFSTIADFSEIVTNSPDHKGNQ